MFEQLNFIDEMERVKEENERFEKKAKAYNKWLTIPEETQAPDGSEERRQVRYDLWPPGFSIYKDAHHECEFLPDNEYVWLNPAASWGGKEYWVLNERGVAEGKHIEICPYCGAGLSAGRGDVVLQKGEERHWRGYLYLDVPKHEGRKPTRLERLMCYHDRKSSEEVMEIYQRELMSEQFGNNYKTAPSNDYAR